MATVGVLLILVGERSNQCWQWDTIRAASIHVHSETAPIHVWMVKRGHPYHPPHSPPCEWLLWVVWLLKFEDAFWGAACPTSHWCLQLSSGWATSWLAKFWGWVTNAYNVYTPCPDGSDRRRGTLVRPQSLWIPSMPRGNTEMEHPTSKQTFNHWIQPWKQLITHRHRTKQCIGINQV